MGTGTPVEGSHQERLTCGLAGKDDLGGCTGVERLLRTAVTQEDKWWQCPK